MKLLSLVIILIFINQSYSAAPASPCHNDPNYKSFDFWLGEWEVHDKSGKLQGHNRIEKTADGCLIKEHWTATSKSTGFSINYYNPVTERWSQQWVSTGSVIEYSGKLIKPGQLTLTGTIYYHANKIEAPFRGTWTLLDDGRVRQLFEQYSAKDDVWTIWFDGYYSKQVN